MERAEFAIGIKKIQNAYNTKFEAEKIDLWWNNLKNMDGNKYLKRVDELINTSKFIPNIAEILDKSKLENCEQRDYSNMDFSKYYANLNYKNGAQK